MFKKVDTKEIEGIKKRLEVELEDKNLPFQRREEVTALLNYIDTWLEWRSFQEKKRIKPTGTITPQKDIFKFKSKNIGVFKKPKIERKP